MLDKDPELTEAVENWLNSENSKKDSREELIAMMRIKLKRYSMTELEALTGIKRPTIYYMIFGKEGKSGRDRTS